MRLVRSVNTFAPMAHTGYLSVHVEEPNLMVSRVEIRPDVSLAHAKALLSATAKYPLTRVEIKPVTIHSGIHGEALNKIILGQLQKEIIVDIMKNKAFNGHRALNPMTF